MRFWYDHGASGWGRLAVSAGMAVFWALVITAAVRLVRVLGRAPGRARLPAAEPPPERAADRFAHGEADVRESR